MEDNQSETVHKFNTDNAHGLDNPMRQQMIDVDQVMRDIKPNKLDVWADIGAGTGVFSLPLSHYVSEVLAVDISNKVLSILKEKIAQTKTTNIGIYQSQESSINLSDSCVDGILMAFVAHELAVPAVYFRELARILKPGGRLDIIEFTKAATMGPPQSNRLDVERVDQWAKSVGMTRQKTWHWSKSVLGWEYIKTK